MTPANRINLRDVKTPGEFIIPPGAELGFENVEGQILWFTLKDGKLSFPAAAEVKSWNSPGPYKVGLKNCRTVFFCIVSEAGGDATVSNSAVYGAGLYFGGESKAAFKDVHNGRALKDHTVSAADRKLRMIDSTVTAWNFYAGEKAALTIEGCTFGEALAFVEGRMDIRDSTCDGSGGYVGAENKAHITLTRCTIKSLAVAKDEGTLILEDCEITGDVRAVGKATVRLKNCRVSGKIECDPTATLTQS
jgi:hypothetical protein